MLNPHSNWFDFSLYEFSVFCVIFIIATISTVNTKDVRISVIIFIFCFSF